MPTWITVIWVIFLGIATTTAQSQKISLNVDTFLSWTVNYKSDIVEMTIQTKINHSELGWIGVGFSDYGEIKPSDLCVLWTDWKGHVKFQDTWVDAKGIISQDRKQDCKNFHYVWKKDGLLTYYFFRKFDTCDRKDYIIEEGTTHVVWIRGTGPLFSIQGLDVKSATESGFQRTTLLYNPNKPSKHPANTFTYEIRAKNTLVPNEETTYWCTVYKLPENMKKKHHIIQYEKAVDEKSGHLVHHMEVFHCYAKSNEEIPMYEGACHGPKRPEKTRVCSRVVAAWAMGAPPFIYPEEAGLPIGGPEYNPYVMLEIHYHNPGRISGMKDTSGFRIHLTPSLRKYDAGIMELGLEYNDKMAIPPKQQRFSLNGFCISECTAVGLPPKGIIVFGSQLHTHLTGVRVFTKHVRNGVELPELNRDNHYSQHLQEIRRLKHPVRVMPGDALITSCEYNTMDRENVTLTGFSISDEMCVNYIHYYPVTKLEVCKSSIPTDELENYFEVMATWEGQATSSKKGISDNYKAIEWNPKRVADVQKLYMTSSISMQCNQSSGERFPGGWEGLRHTQILLPLPGKHRKCGSSDKF